jgi:hypothetical protein
LIPSPLADKAFRAESPTTDSESFTVPTQLTLGVGVPLTVSAIPTVGKFAVTCEAGASCDGGGKEEDEAAPLRKPVAHTSSPIIEITVMRTAFRLIQPSLLKVH